jgi:hypothetical protein
VAPFGDRGDEVVREGGLGDEFVDSGSGESNEFISMFVKFPCFAVGWMECRFADEVSGADWHLRGASMGRLWRRRGFTNKR